GGLHHLQGHRQGAPAEQRLRRIEAVGGLRVRELHRGAARAQPPHGVQSALDRLVVGWDQRESGLPGGAARSVFGVTKRGEYILLSRPLIVDIRRHIWWCPF